MTLPHDYKLQDLLITKHIAELLMDRCVDIEVLKAINKARFQIKQINTQQRIGLSKLIVLVNQWETINNNLGNTEK